MEQNNNVTYGYNESNYTISNYNTSLLGSSFIINNSDTYETKLLGKHNIYNLTCIIVLLKEMGYSYEEIENVIKDLNCPPGRMDTINYNTNNIIVDYAHTPDAIENVLNSVKDLNPNHIYTIVGCGGNRDKTKRPIMAEVATNLSDYVIFTSDNPITEDPKKIMDDINSKYKSSVVMPAIFFEENNK